jgi:signal transduction histidine kinase
LATIFVDPTHLRTALLNLALNSRDAMPSGGHLTLEARYANEESDTILLRTTDTGSGIAADDLTKVCEPFFSTKGLHGTGLGLPMVHGFVKQSGGDMHISSSPGEGTCVELSLPAHLRQEGLLHGVLPVSIDRGEPGARLQGAPL